MMKLEELLILADELNECGSDLISIAQRLRVIFKAAMDEFKGEPKLEKPKITIEDVRKVCAQKSLEGKTAQVRELLKRHGVDSLPAVNPSEYEALLQETEVL